MEKLPQGKTKHNILLFWLMGAFVVYAIYVVLFGTLSTTMMDFYAINTGAQGVFTMVSSIGGIAAALFCALAGERFSKLWAIMIGTLLLGAAALGIGLAPPYLLACLFSLLCGVGSVSYTHLRTCYQLLSKQTSQSYVQDETNIEYGLNNTCASGYIFLS